MGPESVFPYMAELLMFLFEREEETEIGRS
jgi:hypothetical protein